MIFNCSQFKQCTKSIEQDMKINVFRTHSREKKKTHRISILTTIDFVFVFFSAFVPIYLVVAIQPNAKSMFDSAEIYRRTCLLYATENSSQRTNTGFGGWLFFFVSNFPVRFMSRFKRMHSICGRYEFAHTFFCSFCAAEYSE